MKLLKQYHEILTPINRVEMLKAIEIAGRVCYKSEDKITEDSASAFVKKIVKSGHLSVLEHQSVTVRFVTNRGVTHALVRHRICSYSQESTIYCNYNKTKFGSQVQFIIPFWCKDIPEGEFSLGDMEPQKNINDQRWLEAMQNAEITYLQIVRGGWPAKLARGVLPNDLKTELVVTANLRQWKEIFRQRCATDDHPQTNELMIPLRNKFMELLPEIFSDKEKENAKPFNKDLQLKLEF